jgi:hypothetical protein
MLTDDVIATVFASDLAQDVRAEFNERRGYGMSVADATGEVVAAFRHLLERPDEGPVVIAALAALQLREGELHAAVRDAAVVLLRAGRGFERQAGEAMDRRRERERVRQELVEALAAAAVVNH